MRGSPFGARERDERKARRIQRKRFRLLMKCLCPERNVLTGALTRCNATCIYYRARRERKEFTRVHFQALPRRLMRIQIETRQLDDPVDLREKLTTKILTLYLRRLVSN